MTQLSNMTQNDLRLQMKNVKQIPELLLGNMKNSLAELIDNRIIAAEDRIIALEDNSSIQQ